MVTTDISVIGERNSEKLDNLLSNPNIVLLENCDAKDKLLSYALRDKIYEAKFCDLVKGETVYIEDLSKIRDSLYRVGKLWNKHAWYGKAVELGDSNLGIKLSQINDTTFRFYNGNFIADFKVIPDKTIDLSKAVNIDKLTETMKRGHEAYEYLETMAFLNAIREIIVEDLVSGEKQKSGYDGKLFIKLINAWKESPAMGYGGQMGYLRGKGECLHLQQIDSTKFAMWNDKLRAVFVCNDITPEEMHKAEKENYQLYYTERGKEWFAKADEGKGKGHSKHGHLVLMTAPSGKKRWMNPDKAKKKGYKPVGQDQAQPEKKKPETKEKRYVQGVFGKDYGEIVSFKYKGSKDERQKRRMGVYLGDAVTKNGKKVRHFIDLSLDKKEIPDEETEPSKFKKFLNKIKKLPKIMKIKRYLNKYKKKYEGSDVSPETIYRLISKGLMNKYPDLKYRTFKPRKMRKSEELFIYVNGELAETFRA